MTVHLMVTGGKQWTFYIVPVQIPLQKWLANGFGWVNCGGTASRAVGIRFPKRVIQNQVSRRVGCRQRFRAAICAQRNGCRDRVWETRAAVMFSRECGNDFAGSLAMPHIHVAGRHGARTLLCSDAITASNPPRDECSRRDMSLRRDREPSRLDC